MKVIAWDPWLTPEEVNLRGAELVEMDTLLAESDFVSLHLRLGPRTDRLLGTREFNLMKQSAYLINTARGGLVDEDALSTAIREGRIAGAALDTIDPEPPLSSNPLLHLPQVVVTGHYASVSEEANRDRHHQVAETIRRFSLGLWPEFVANPEVKPRVPLSRS
jgi:D-3-phosphoglycerate dehydrogenase